MRQARSRAAIAVALTSIFVVVTLLQNEGGVTTYEREAAEPADEGPPSFDLQLIQAEENAQGRILRVEPHKGPSSGLNLVTITGQAMSNGSPSDIATVRIAGIPADRIISHTPSQIILRAPRLTGETTPGLAAIEVTSHSLGRTVQANAYRYQPSPILLSVSPDNGRHDGATELTIRGRNLCDHTTAGTPTVTLCGRKLATSRCEDGKVVTTTPPDARQSAGGPCTVLVSSHLFGTAKLREGFKYWGAPEITEVTPTRGPLRGGGILTIRGFELTEGEHRRMERVNVKMGGRTARVLSFTPESIRVRVPRGLKHPGLVDIVTSSKIRGESTARGLYRLNRAATITGISRHSARSSGGQMLSIHAKDLGTDVERVRIGDHEATIVRVTPVGSHRTLIEVETPSFSQDESGKDHTVMVESISTGRAVLRKSLSIIRGSHIHTVTPQTGPSEGGTLLTITGDRLCVGLNDILAVKVADTDAQVVTATGGVITVRTSKGVPDTKGDIEIHSRSGGVIKSRGEGTHYEYAKHGQVLQVRPNQGSLQGNTLVTILGTNLCSGTCEDLSIDFGGLKATSLVSQSPSRIVVRTPTSPSAGLLDVRVYSERTGAAAALSAFEYTEESAIGSVYPHSVPIGSHRRVEITGRDFGKGAKYEVLMAGVPAKVLSASPQKIVVVPGNIKKEDHSEGLEGTVSIGRWTEGLRTEGRLLGMDTRIGFRYNPSCSILNADLAPGPADGLLRLTLTGRHLGVGDERIHLNGNLIVDAGTVERRVGGVESDVRQLTALVRASALHPEATLTSVSVRSERSGSCEVSLRGLLSKATTLQQGSFDNPSTEPMVVKPHLPTVSELKQELRRVSKKARKSVIKHHTPVVATTPTARLQIEKTAIPYPTIAVNTGRIEHGADVKKKKISGDAMASLTSVAELENEEAAHAADISTHQKNQRVKGLELVDDLKDDDGADMVDDFLDGGYVAAAY